MHQTGLFYSGVTRASLAGVISNFIIIIMRNESNPLVHLHLLKICFLRKLDALDASLPHAVMLPLASPSQSRLTEREKKERESECLYAYILE
jgi:hypothetical protein